MPKLLALLLAASAAAPALESNELERWEAQARDVRIVRDDWGIAHIHGKTDADAVFGAMYAQAEDDFGRIETNYLNAMGRLAEAEGEAKVIQDLRMRLFIDPADLRAKYAASPAWLKKLMDAFAAGLNFYLAKHPLVKPRVIERFEPWMALSFTEGSIGGDIESINLARLGAFYAGKAGEAAAAADATPQEPRGSNGVAIAPSNTASKHALLLINPHTTFFFRSELQMSSDEGLNAYGASTWGQFFIYQGFNDRAGWMHTTSGVDAVDEYLETVEKAESGHVYKYGLKTRPVVEKRIVIAYRGKDGAMAEKTFAAYSTHHGPVIREANGKWVSVRLMREPVKALSQSYLRTKARSYADFLKTMELKANSSNNTIYADADGTIAYFHGNFLPRRNRKFDWTKPVDGADKAAEWGAPHAVRDLPNLKNPASGWLYNANDSPWSAAGQSSPRQADYPAYAESGVESARGLHAVRVLADRRDFTLDSLLAAAYDSYLPWFEKPLPALARAWDALPTTDPRRAQLSAQIAMLRGWDLRWSVSSVATSLAVHWGDELRKRNDAGPTRGVNLALAEYAATKAPAALLLDCLKAASAKLEADFGKWNTPWGDINRFQRINGDLAQPFSDSAPSAPVGFTSAAWGSLASFGARPHPGTKKWYGTSGNSFVAVVEFGETVRARAVSAGGESGNPAEKHFNDQAERYAAGDLREVYFYKSQLQGHTEREYYPGN